MASSPMHKRTKRFTDVLDRIAAYCKRNRERFHRGGFPNPGFIVWTRPIGFNDHGEYPERHFLEVVFRPRFLGIIPRRRRHVVLVEIQDRWRDPKCARATVNQSCVHADETVQPLLCIVYHEALTAVVAHEAGRLASESGFDGLEIARKYPHDREPTLGELESERNLLADSLRRLDDAEKSLEHQLSEIDSQREKVIARLRSFQDGPEARILQLRSGRL